MRVHTIGFTRRSAEEFFSLLREAGITRLLDVRLRNTSQLAGFTKRDDLAFFLASSSVATTSTAPSSPRRRSCSGAGVARG